MAGYRDTETDSSDSHSLTDEDFIPPESSLESPRIPAPPSDGPRVEDFSLLIPPPPYSGSDSPREEDLCPPIPPPPAFRSASDAAWRSMSYRRPLPCYVTPYLPRVAPPGQPMYRYLTPESEQQGMYVYSPIPPIEYPQVTSDARGYLTIPFPPTTVTTWLSNSSTVTPTINALGSIPAPYVSGYEGTMWNSGRSRRGKGRGRGGGRGGRGITRRVTMFFGPVSRPWPRYSSDLYSTISNLSLKAITLSEATGSREEKEETRALCISAPEEKVESGASCISGDSTPEPLGPTESTPTTNMISDVKMNTNLNQKSRYGPEPAAVMQPTTESPLTIEAGPINVDPVSSLYDSADPQPRPLTPKTPHDPTNSRAKMKTKTSSSGTLKLSNIGKKPGLIGSNKITQNPGPSSEAEIDPTFRSSKPLKLYDFLSPKLNEARVGNVPEMLSEKPSSLENVNSPSTLEMDSAVQWPRLAPVKSRPIPQSEIHMHLQWPTIGHVRRAARTAIASQVQPSDQPLADYENPALEAEMASVQAQMPPDLDNLAFLALFAAEVWPELPPGDPELMDLISQILRETWLLLDPEDRQSLARLAALCAWPQRPESEIPD